MGELLNEAVLGATLLVPVIGILVKLVKSADIDSRWLPFWSIGLGIGTGVVLAIASGEPLTVYALAGFLAGASSSGLYDALKSTKGE